MFNRAKYKEGVPYEDIENPVGSKKYDGAHFYMQFDWKGNPRFISRRESVRGGFPDRTEKVPHLAKTIPQLAGNVYSVELIHTGHNTGPYAKESHPAISGILNSLKDKALDTQKNTGPVRAVLLDVLSPQVKTYGEKLKHLKSVEAAFGDSNLLFTPDTKIGLDAISELIQRTKQNGDEGVVITSATEPESSNFRIKIKHKNTYNLKVIGIQQEVDIKGNTKESAGALELEDATGRYVGKVGTGFTREDRISIWKNRSRWLNKLVQITAMKPTAGLIRSATYNGLADGDIDKV